ncbi:stearoyl-CoA desaturase 5-like [Diorhabda sublineata]|uniref:stearoyl-CoA desaturase 5-like n=1 Tax=Diorhabda sublineata TaxID=1163346 RepID=UPI0024E096DF|nr:stearoyl-CoA desaturase 5-like [Diorhabda sublineata]
MITISSFLPTYQHLDEESSKQPLFSSTNIINYDKDTNKNLINNNTKSKDSNSIDRIGKNDDTEEVNDTTIDKNEYEEEKLIRVYGKYKFLLWEFETPIIWYSVFFITIWHILSVYFVAIYPFPEKMPLTIYAFCIGGLSGFGITAGAHRYFTHRSYKAKLPLKLILLMCYSIAGQNSLYDWVRDHRVHHKFSETNADPHNANRGLFFSHVGWLMMRKHPEVIRKGRKLDLTDLTDDPLIAFHIKHWTLIKLFFCFILPSSIPPLVWKESWFYSIAAICFVRYILSLNFTWSVNSFAHLYGHRPYDKKIFPVENVTVSFFALGEGYHNYHHTFPWDYRAAELGQKLNITTVWLDFFQKIGWAYDMKAPSNELVRKVAIKNGDGTHYKWGHEVPETADCSTKEIRNTR